MTNEKSQPDLCENAFRRGATHGVHWVKQEAALKAQQGSSTQQVLDWMGTLGQVLLDWRSMQNCLNLPDGCPWEWSKEDLEAYINRRCVEW
jgi:hypothetical protein